MWKCMLLISLLQSYSINDGITDKPDLILGRWITAERNSLIVDVYKTNNEYKARIVWFNDRDDKSRPMDTRYDIKNPDKRLRSRKLIGMDVMNGLEFNETEKEWQSGKIYDALSGRTWEVKANINKEGLLCVRGYWHLPIFGNTMKFKKYKP